MKKLILILVCVIGNLTSSWSQQLPQYTQQSFHQFSLNPALAGNNTCIDIRSIYRNQWVGVPESPTGGVFTLSARVFDKNSDYLAAYHGIGLRIERDAFGPFAHNRLQLAYAVHLPINDHMTLSFGSFAGLDNMSYDASKVSSIDPDPAVQNSSFSYLAPDVTFGTWLTGKKFFAGLSAQHLIPISYDLGIEASKRLHVTLTGGTKINVDIDGVSILPVAFVRIPPAGPVGIDIHALVDYRNIITGGIGYRRQESLLFLLRYKFLGFYTVAYSFDFVTNRLKGNMGHTHEISIGIATCKSKDQGSSSCPIFE
jgi:type IX secretion system PorP/SprF family membrane protein